jgi:hypothetical protein
MALSSWNSFACVQSIMTEKPCLAYFTKEEIEKAGGLKDDQV